MPLTVTDAVLPVVVAPPGERVTVHEPDGKPLSTTEPVDELQFVCVIVPIVGADTTGGCVTVTGFAVAVHKFASFIVTV